MKTLVVVRNQAVAEKLGTYFPDDVKVVGYLHPLTGCKFDKIVIIQPNDPLDNQDKVNSWCELLKTKLGPDGSIFMLLG